MSLGQYYRRMDIPYCPRDKVSAWLYPFAYCEHTNYVHQKISERLTHLDMQQIDFSDTNNSCITWKPTFTATIEKLMWTFLLNLVRC